MARVKVKQLYNGAIPSGAVIVSNGTLADWSSNSTGALRLPSGTTAQQPTGVNGLLRYNSDLNRLEAYVNGSWQAVQAGSVNLDSLSDVTITSPVTGHTLVYNGTVFENVPGFRVYRFRVNFDGSVAIATTNSFESVPSGWTLTRDGDNQFTATHNLGRPFFMLAGAAWSGTNFVVRYPNGAPTAQYSTQQPGTAPNSFTVYGASATNASATANQYIIYSAIYYMG